MAEIIYKEESYSIIGACFEVYKEMGCGFLEPVYQECLELASEHRAQVHNYLHATRHTLGLLVNFGHIPQRRVRTHRPLTPPS